MLLPYVATEEDILHANLDYMIDIFGYDFSVLINNYNIFIEL
jgi:hypothetical protein